MQSINVKIKNTLSRICNKFAGKFKQLLSLQGERLKRAKPIYNVTPHQSKNLWWCKPVSVLLRVPRHLILQKIRLCILRRNL